MASEKVPNRSAIGNRATNSKPLFCRARRARFAWLEHRQRGHGQRYAEGAASTVSTSLGTACGGAHMGATAPIPPVRGERFCVAKSSEYTSLKWPAGGTAPGTNTTKPLNARKLWSAFEAATGSKGSAAKAKTEPLQQSWEGG
jgi:hypothetical protein